MITPEEGAALQAPFADTEIEILPTGEVYLPQVLYRRRLNAVLGVGDWRLAPESDHVVEGQTVNREYCLYVRGVPIGYAWGEHTRHDDDTLALAIESARSTALARCCKDLGIASQCWDKRGFIDRFVREHCVQVWVDGKQRPQWRRKDSAPFRGEKGPVSRGGSDRAAAGSRTTAIGPGSAVHRG